MSASSSRPSRSRPRSRPAARSATALPVPAAVPGWGVEAARAWHARATGLSDRPSAALAAVVAHLGYVQLDPLNICGRMHDLVLRNRVADYRAGDLLRWLHGAPEATGATPATAVPRGGFEFYLPGAGILVAFPWEAWTYLQPAMRECRIRARGYHGALSAAEEAVAQHILRELAERGPLSSDDIAHEGRGTTAWGSRAKLTKIVLEKIFAHGRVLIAARRQFRRIYDLPERVVPPAVLEQPPADAAAAARWLVLLRLRQRRLVRLRAAEAALVSELVTPVVVPGAPRLYALRADVSEEQLQKRPAAVHWAAAPAATPVPGAPAPLLLAPLDPLIYDRVVTRQLWDFTYTWEVYVPAAKRVRGYYALPVLAAGRLVGHVEPRYDARTGRLQVLSRRVPRGVSLVPSLAALARCLQGETSATPVARPPAGG